MVWATPTVQTAMREYQDFRAEMGPKLNKAEERLDEMSQSVAQSHVAEEIRRLQGERQKLRNKLNESRYEGREKWMAFVKEFRQAEDHLENKIRKLENLYLRK